MKHPDFVRLPPTLEPAAQTLKLAARAAVERTIESLGLAALAASHAFQRDGLLAAQFELNRKSAVFVLSFNEAFDERVLRELGSPVSAAGADGMPAAGASAWESLSLVADQEVEQQIGADRFGLEVTHACEWELREFDALVAALLPGPVGSSSRERNPLRPQVVGHAMVKALQAVSDRQDVRQQLASEISRSLAALLRPAYADIVRDLRHAGVQPRGLFLRPRQAPPGAGGAAGFDPSGQAPPPDAAASRHGAHSAYGMQGAGSMHGTHSGYGSYSRSGVSGHGTYGSPGPHGIPAGGLGPRDPGAGPWQPPPAQDPLTGVARSAGHRGGWDAGPSLRPSLGVVDPGLMNVLRRLSQDGTRRYGGGQAGAGPYPGAAGPATDWSDAGPAVPNLIVAHREELRQASRGALDHLVIDVIASLFDQILSDPKVPPQLARLIARLQLPVLRAALGDSSFFSSRRHPVRRFINRIASLGAAFDDYSEPAAQRFLAKVRALIEAVVEGDFDRLETYEETLRALETFLAAPAEPAAPAADRPRADAAATDAAAQAAELLAQKEDELQLRQLYARRLEGELRSLAGPEFVRDFVSRIWSQVLVRATAAAGAASEPATEGATVRKLRQTGRDLFMSVQPKATPAARKAFLAGLPRLMQELTEGMDLIAWPEEQRRAFFGQLMPAHAEALRNSAMSQLDVNLLARQVEAALAQPLPTALDVRAAAAHLSARAAPTDDPEALLAGLTPAEAQQVGLVPEEAVDWTAPAVPPPQARSAAEASADDEAAMLPASEPLLPGAPLPAQPAEAPEPTHGAALAQHVQLGCAYQMQLDGQWQKVRLAHVSPARSFFIFSHGSERARKTVTFSRRMLEKLCAAGRLRAFEQADLVERATARARRQLAKLAAPG